MNRLLVACLVGVLGCHRAPRPVVSARPVHPPPATVPGASPGALAAALPAHPAAHEIGEPEGEHEEIMNPVEDMSPYPDSAAGAEAMVRALSHEAIRHDAEGLARAERHLDADATHLELALTFDGARSVGLRTVAGVPAARTALVNRLAALREPLGITVASALGGELSDGAPHGLDPRLARMHTSLRPGVKFYRVEVTGAGSADRVVVEPLAYLGGRWTYLGEPWDGSAETPTGPVVPTVPPTVPTH